MPIDPAGKMSKLRAARDVARMANGEKRRPGRLSKLERAIVGEVVNSEPDLSPTRQVALALALNKPTDTVTRAVKQARATFEANADKYVALHLDTAMSALADREYDVARKAAEFAIEKVSHVDDEGKSHRIVDAVVSTTNVPKIQIGIALGGLPGKS